MRYAPAASSAGRSPGSPFDPVIAPGWTARALPGVGHDEVVLLGELVPLGGDRDAVWCLAAAVQHHDQRHPAADPVARGGVDVVGRRPARTGEQVGARPGQPGLGRGRSDVSPDCRHGFGCGHLLISPSYTSRSTRLRPTIGDTSAPGIDRAFRRPCFSVTRNRRWRVQIPPRLLQHEALASLPDRSPA